MLTKKILVIYPQVHDTKIAVSQNNSWGFFKTTLFKKEDAEKYGSVIKQEIPRTNQILTELEDNEIHLENIQMVIGSGGVGKPIKSRIYGINKKLKNNLAKCERLKESNLDGLITDRVAKMILDVRIFLADPVVVDELSDLVRVSEHPMVERKSIFHALDHKFPCRNYSESINEHYEELNLVSAHVGEGGISIGTHNLGRVIDVNQAYVGEGPFAYTRSGSLPYGDLIDVCYSGESTKKEHRKMLIHEGGLEAHLDTSNINLIENRIKKGDHKAEFILKAMAYQLSKEIGALTVVFDEPVDAIILSGNIFQSKFFTEAVKSHIFKLGQVIISPFVSDMDSLADSAMLIMKDEAEILVYE